MVAERDAKNRRGVRPVRYEGAWGSGDQPEGRDVLWADPAEVAVVQGDDEAYLPGLHGRNHILRRSKRRLTCAKDRW